MSAPTDSIEVNALDAGTPALGDLLHANDINGTPTNKSIRITIQQAIELYNTLTATMTNKTLTAPVISTISNTGTITLPTSTDTLVGKATTDTLTNKTIDADGTGNSITNIDVPEMQSGSNILISGIEFVIDGGGSAITTGVKGYIEVPFDCTINRVTLLADQSGSIVVDIWKDVYANYPPTDADSITASAVPTITSDTDSQDATLTGWTTAVTAGDILGYNVDSATTITRVTVSLQVTKTE